MRWYDEFCCNTNNVCCVHIHLHIRLIANVCFRQKSTFRPVQCRLSCTLCCIRRHPTVSLTHHRPRVNFGWIRGEEVEGIALPRIGLFVGLCLAGRLTSAYLISAKLRAKLTARYARALSFRGRGRFAPPTKLPSKGFVPGSR